MNKRILRRSITKLALWLGGPALLVSAADVYWSGSQDESFSTMENWSVDSDQSAPFGAVPGAADIAIFNAGGLLDFQIKALGAVQSVEGIVFNAQATANITITDTRALTIGTSGITLDAGTGAHTIAAPMIIGASQLWANNSANPFTTSGTLSLVGENLTLGGTGGFTFSGQTLIKNSNRIVTVTTPGEVSFGAISTVDGSTPRLIIFDVASGSTVDVDGAITGSGAVRKDGPGTLNFNATNSFSSIMSGLFITDGTVNVNASNSGNPKLNLGSVAGGAPVLNLASGVNYRVQNIDYLAAGDPFGAVIKGEGTLSLNGGRTFMIEDSANSDAELTIDVAVRNQAGGGGSAQALAKSGSGTLVFNGVNDFSGTFTIYSGTVVQNATQAVAGSLTFGGTSTLTIGSGAEFVLGGSLTVYTAASGAVINGEGGLRLVTGSGTRVFSIADGAEDIDFTASVGLLAGLSGTQNVQKIGLGRMVSGGVNTYAGTTELVRGELVLDYSVHNGDNKLSNSANVNLRGGMLSLMGNATAGTTESIGTGQLRIMSATNIVSLISNGGQTLTFDINDISRGTGEGLIDFRSNDTSLATFQTAEANNPAGIIGAYATLNGMRFAANDGTGRIVAMEGVVGNDRAQWQTGDHVVIDGALTGAMSASRLGTLVFDAPVSNTLILDNPFGALTLDAGGILVSANVGANNTTITGGQISIPATPDGAISLVLTNYSTGTLEVASSLGGNNTPLSGALELTIGGTGEVLLSGRNFLSGDTNIQGNVRLSGGEAIGDFRGVVLGASGDGIVLNLDGSTEAIGYLLGGGSSSLTDARVDLGDGGTLILNQTMSGSYSGLLSGSGQVIKRGGGTFGNSTNSLTFTGSVQILGGQFDLTGTNSGLSAVDNVLIRGGQLRSEQNHSSSVNKFNDAATIRLEGTTENGLRVTSNQNGSRTEKAGVINLAAGSNVVTVDNSTTIATIANTTFQLIDPTAGLVRGNQATLLVRGDSLGADVAPRRTRIIFDSGVEELLVGTGARATSAAILPFAIGSTVDNGLGDSFVTDGATNGLRPLDIADEYETNYATAIGHGDDNFSTATSLGGLASGTLNALRIDTSGGTVAFTGVNDGMTTLTLTSGALLVSAGSSANAATLGGFEQILAGTSAAGDDEFIIHVTSSEAAAQLTISSSLADQATGGGRTFLTKSGGGTLVLDGANTYSGTTMINDGVVEFSDWANLGTGSVIGISSGTLRWSAGNTTDISTRTVDLIGASVFLTPAAISTTTGGNILSAGAVFDIGANDVTLANPIGNNGVGGLTKIGSGTLTLGATPNYAGATLVTEGALNFQTIAADSTPALYILANTGVVSSTVTNGLNLQQLIVGGVYSGKTSGTGTLTVSGGAVSIGNGSGDDFVLLGWRDGSAGSAPNGTQLIGIADFTAASGVNIDVTQIALGEFVSGVTGNQSTSRGELLLPTAQSAVNTITANLVTVGNAPGGVFNTDDTSILHLGAGDTTLNVNTLVVGGRKSAGVLDIDAGGTSTLRGLAGGDSAANVFIGENDNGQSSTGTRSDGLVDLSGATADWNVLYLNIGRLSFSSAEGSATGTLIFDTGTIQASSVRLADPNYAPGSNPKTSNNFATDGTIFQGGGTFRFEELSKGDGTASFLWNAGTIQNVAGRDLVNRNVIVNLDTFDPRTFAVEAGRTAVFEADANFTGGGGFTKEGAGTLRLDGTNDYTGDTVVNEGRLLVNGTNSGSLVFVEDGGTLGGTGLVAPPVVIASGGTLAPGDEIGVLTTGDVSLESGAVFRLELGGTLAGNTAINHDQLIVNGSVNLLGDAAVSLSFAGGYTPVVGDIFYVILNNGTLDAVMGGFANVSNGMLAGIDGSQFRVSYSAEFGVGFEDAGNDVALELTVVPEPGSVVALLGGMGLLLGLQRFRPRKAC